LLTEIKSKSEIRDDDYSHNLILVRGYGSKRFSADQAMADALKSWHWFREIVRLSAL
jgi:hypothetical protein